MTNPTGPQTPWDSKPPTLPLARGWRDCREEQGLPDGSGAPSSQEHANRPALETRRALGFRFQMPAHSPPHSASSGTFSAGREFMLFTSCESLTQAPLHPDRPDACTKGFSCSRPALKANLVLHLHLVHLVVSVLNVPSVPCFAD